MTALAICRFAHFMATMLAFGASAYLWLDSPKSLRRRLAPRSARRGGLDALALLTAIRGWRWRRPRWPATGAPPSIPEPSAAFSPTPTSARRGACGSSWRRRLSPSSPSAPAIDGRRSRSSPRALLASLGLVGHAAMQAGLVGIAHRANHAVHLVTAGAWFGGLVPFALSLRAHEDDDLRPDAVRAMARFSFWDNSSSRRRCHRGRQHRADIRPPADPADDALPRPARRQDRHRRRHDRARALQPHLSLAQAEARRARPRRAAFTSLIEVALGTVVVALVSVFAMLSPA